MSPHFNTLLLSQALLLAACSGSDTYQGHWKAMSPDGVKADLHFDVKSFTEKNTNGETTTFQYTQHSVNIDNGVKSYGIKLAEGGSYIIVFPVKGDATKGVITTEAGSPFYTISRTDYITYEELYSFGK